MIDERCFLDTNVLVYLFDNDASEKQSKAREILASALHDTELIISTQVLQEFFVAVPRKLAQPLPVEYARQAVNDLIALKVRQVTPSLILAAIRRVEASRLSFWDSLIIETALEGGASVLLTEDL